MSNAQIKHTFSSATLIADAENPKYKRATLPEISGARFTPTALETALNAVEDYEQRDYLFKNICGTRADIFTLETFIAAYESYKRADKPLDGWFARHCATLGYEFLTTQPSSYNSVRIYGATILSPAVKDSRTSRMYLNREAITLYPAKDESLIDRAKAALGEHITALDKYETTLLNLTQLNAVAAAYRKAIEKLSAGFEADKKALTGDTLRYVPGLSIK